MKFTPPPIADVANALDKERRKMFLNYRDDFALHYYQRHKNDEEFLEKVLQALEIIEARRNRIECRPLMPTMSSNHYTYSRIDRRDYGQQRHPSPRTLLNWLRNRPSYIPRDRPQPCLNIHNIQNTPSVSANNSQGKTIDKTVPFIMGTLKNVDNSCYMNTLLYILRMTPTFVHGIHHLLENMLAIAEDDPIEMTVTPGECLQRVATSVMVSNKDKWPNESNIDGRQEEVILLLHRIFSKLTANELHKDNEPLEKGKFLEAIRETAPNFGFETQEDSHEFLLTVLNCIRDCGASLAKLIQEHASMFDNIIEPATRLSFDLIEKNFIGKEMTTTKCVCCETESDRIDDLMYFYIPLPEKKEFGKNFIRESLDMKVHVLEIKCEECQHSQVSLQSKSYPQLPRILIFQLGRFDNYLNKKHTITPTPMELDCFCIPCMKNQNGEERIDHKYRLYGVIVHLGVTLRSGHYTAYVRTFADNEQQQQAKNRCRSNICCQLKFKQTKTDENTEMDNNCWYHCNDELIEIMSEMEVKARINREGSTSTPYILFYVRNDLLADY